MRHARGGTTATPEPSADHQLMAVLMDSPFPLQKCALGAVMGAFGSAVVRNEGSFRDIGACGTIGDKSMRWKSIGVKIGLGSEPGAEGAGVPAALRGPGDVLWQPAGA